MSIDKINLFKTSADSVYLSGEVIVGGTVKSYYRVVVTGDEVTAWANVGGSMVYDYTEELFKHRRECIHNIYRTKNAVISQAVVMDATNETVIFWDNASRILPFEAWNEFTNLDPTSDIGMMVMELFTAVFENGDKDVIDNVLKRHFKEIEHQAEEYMHDSIYGTYTPAK